MRLNIKLHLTHLPLRQSNKMIKRHSIATAGCVMLIGLTGLCGCGSSSYTEKDTAGITKEAQEQKKTVAESVESDDSTKATTKEQ